MAGAEAPAGEKGADAPTLVLPCEEETAWETAKAVLLSPVFATFEDFELAMARYSSWRLHPEAKEEEVNSEAIPPQDILRALRRCVEDRDGGEQGFLQQLLPFIQHEALQLPARLAGRRLPLPLPGMVATVELARPLVSSLLACAFFGLFRDQRVRGESKLQMPEANWDTLLSYCPNHVPFVLHYFHRLRGTTPTGVLRIHRKVLAVALDAEDWQASDAPLVEVQVHGEGAIEDRPDLLQADFANEFLGGGVLQGGNVQEEIRFLLSPECLAAMLLCPRMEALEAIQLEGVERFSCHSGYGGRLRWKENFIDTHKLDSGQPRTKLVAFDALMLEGEPQYATPAKLRELNKAYVAFRALPEEETATLPPIATGNWGCGMFGGCRHLKFVLQWLAASQAGRPMHYFLFDETRLADRIEALLQAIKEVAAKQQKSFTVGQLSRLVFATEFEMRREFLPWLTARVASSPSPA